MKRVGSGRVKGLTPLQRRLREEIEEIASIINMDHWNILQYAPEARTTYLQLMRIQLVRSEVISLYTLIDEYLTVIICNFYFRKKAADRSFKALWKRPKFKVFN